LKQKDFSDNNPLHTGEVVGSIPTAPTIGINDLGSLFVCTARETAPPSDPDCHFTVPNGIVSLQYRERYHALVGGSVVGFTMIQAIRGMSPVVEWLGRV
jgi:hypothetical protein